MVDGGFLDPSEVETYDSGQHPVESLSWDQAAYFTNLLSEEENIESCYTCQSYTNTECSSHNCTPEANVRLYHL